MSQISNNYVIGHFDWEARGRFTLGVILSAVLFGAFGMNVLGPWDLSGAISLLLVDNQTLLLLRLIGLLVAVGVLSTIIVDGRIKFFGVFVACLGVGLPIMKTAGMGYLMVRLQVGKEFVNSQVLWAYLVLETCLWAVALFALLAAVYATERWIGKDAAEPVREKKVAKGKAAGKGKDIFDGILSTVATVVGALIFVSLLAASQDKGQIIFATFTGFLIASFLAEQLTETSHPMWHCLAVPSVAIIAYSYTWMNPDRPPGFEAVLNIAPNSLARILPIEYIFIGTAGVILGNWYSQRLRYFKENG